MGRGGEEKGGKERGEQRREIERWEERRGEERRGTERRGNGMMEGESRVERRGCDWLCQGKSFSSLLDAVMWHK